jgi:hypothetical protein
MARSCWRPRSLTAPPRCPSATSACQLTAQRIDRSRYGRRRRAGWTSSSPAPDRRIGRPGRRPPNQPRPAPPVSRSPHTPGRLARPPPFARRRERSPRLACPQVAARLPILPPEPAAQATPGGRRCRRRAGRRRRSDRLRSWWLSARSACSVARRHLLIPATGMLPVPSGLWSPAKASISSTGLAA